MVLILLLGSNTYLFLLQKSDLIILAARPSVGKTAFAMDIARQAAIKSKEGVGIFSLEMSKTESLTQAFRR